MTSIVDDGSVIAAGARDGWQRPPVRARSVWWLTPHGFTLGFLVPMMVVIYFVGFWDNPAFTFRGARYLRLEHLFLGLVLLLALALGGWCGSRVELGTQAGRQWPTLESTATAAWVVGGIAFVAYCGWFRDTVFVPSNLIGMFTGAWQPSRDDIGKYPGLTSWTNVGPVFFALIGFLWRFGVVSIGLRIFFAVLVFLTFIRVYLWTERLAMLEALTSLAMMASVFWLPLKSTALRIAYAPLRVLGPYALIPVIALYFGVAEFFRSWQAQVYNGRMDFSDFVLGRLAAYYYTSLNNGAGLLAELDWPTWRGDFAFEWLHRVPFGIGSVVNDLTNSSGDPLMLFLIQAGDYEFNNPCGLFSVVHDFHVYGALVYFFVWGLVAGLIHTDWCRGGVIGFIVHPIMLLSLSEVFRFAYFGHSRSFTWFMGVCIALLVILVVHRRPAALRWQAA